MAQSAARRAERGTQKLGEIYDSKQSGDAHRSTPNEKEPGFHLCSQRVGDVYEFTQLVNSMLTMIISMRAEYFSERPTVSWEKVSQIIRPEVSEKIFSGGPHWDDLQIQASVGSDPHFTTLIDHLRNAFSHCCWEFFSDEQGEIRGLHLWNVPREQDRLKRECQTWQASLTEAQLRALAYIFIEYLEMTRGYEVGIIDQ